MKRLSRILLVIGLTAIVGCIETKDELTVNPDGSGKLVHERTFVSMNLGPGFADSTGGGTPSGDVGGQSSLMTGPQPGSPGGAGTQAQLEQSVKEILSKSSGVDAWKDVSYTITNQGKMYFKGTAYFPDINNLTIHNAILGGPSGGSGSGLVFSRSESGEIIIEMKTGQTGAAGGGAGGAGRGTTPPPVLSEDQLNEQVRQARMQYEQSKPMLQGFFAGFKSEIILHLPGRIKEVTNFEQIDDQTVRIVVDGARLLGIIDRKIQDEMWLKEQIRSGKDPTSSGPNDLEMNELLFGQRAPIRVVVDAAAKPLFDYTTEMTAAKADYQAVLGQLGLKEGPAQAAPEIVTTPAEVTVTEITPPATEEETGMKVIVGGVRLVRLSDFGRGIMPLGQNSGYTLSLIAELPTAVIKVPTGRVEKAITDSGKDLLPKEQWDRKIRFPTLATDNKTVIFDAGLLLPDEAARGLEEVSGILEYLTASGSKEVDLGVIALKVGAKGADLGAVISSIEADPWQKNATMLGLRLDLPAEAIGSVIFSTEDGAKLDITRRSAASINGTTMLKFSVPGNVPASARVVVNVFEDLKKNEIPFRIRNVTLTGQPATSVGGL